MYILNYKKKLNEGVEEMTYNIQFSETLPSDLKGHASKPSWVHLQINLEVGDITRGNRGLSRWTETV